MSLSPFFSDQDGASFSFVSQACERVALLRQTDDELPLHFTQ
jgi:hypothetical protein